MYLQCVWIIPASNRLRGQVLHIGDQGLAVCLLSTARRIIFFLIAKQTLYPVIMKLVMMAAVSSKLNVSSDGLIAK